MTAGRVGTSWWHWRSCGEAGLPGVSVPTFVYF